MLTYTFNLHMFVITLSGTGSDLTYSAKGVENSNQPSFVASKFAVELMMIPPILLMSMRLMRNTSVESSEKRFQHP